MDRCYFQHRIELIIVTILEKFLHTFSNIIMNLIKYEKSQHNDTFALGCFGIIIFALSPLWISALGQYIVDVEHNPTDACNMTNDCGWILIQEYTHYTFPLGLLLLLFYVPIWMWNNHYFDIGNDKNDSVETNRDADQP
jgi:hypothetical protein